MMLPTLDSTLFPRAPLGYGGCFYGVYPALVVDVVDPDGQGRVKVQLPWCRDTGDGSYEVWARLATMMAGPDQGSWFVPDEQSEVLVVFEAGNPRRPYVIGALWNGQDAPPESMDSSGKNELKVLRSRNGVRIVLDDTSGQERLLVETPGGQKIELKDGESSLELSDSNGNSLKLDASGVTITSVGTVTIQASGTMDTTASSVNVTAGMSQFSGAVQANSVISSSVVGSSYTPGAGNIW